MQLTARLQLLKPEYSPAEYAALRELYQRALAKSAEVLVLRRQ
ncbi:hypothetical protein [Hymenobacter algoricola]|uniref:Uncharacterized protein n=1 Tax=Hymenobacter algoricola TaxID=486267 RepID=A0ABP7NNR5_9BACT